MKAANQLVNSVGSTMVSIDAIVDSTNSIFGKGKNGGPNKVQAAATIIAAPVAIMNMASKIITMLGLGLQFKMLMPDALGKGIWDLSAMVLSQLQHQAIQMADEALSKLIKPVEDMLRKLTPSICFGNMGSRLQQQILKTIREFKSRILSEIGGAYSANGDFNAKFQFQIKQSATALQLMAFSAALRAISANFLEAARGCGLSPCTNDQKPIKLKDVGNLEDYWIDTAHNMPTYFPDMQKFPKITSKMDKLAEKLVPSLGLGNGDVYVTPQEVLGVYKVADGAPSKILELINNGALNNILDDNYAIYNTPDGIKVVYRYIKNCGE